MGELFGFLRRGKATRQEPSERNDTFSKKELAIAQECERIFHYIAGFDEQAQQFLMDPDGPLTVYQSLQQLISELETLSTRSEISIELNTLLQDFVESHLKVKNSPLIISNRVVHLSSLVNTVVQWISEAAADEAADLGRKGGTESISLAERINSMKQSVRQLKLGLSQISEIANKVSLEPARLINTVSIPESWWKEVILADAKQKVFGKVISEAQEALGQEKVRNESAEHDLSELEFSDTEWQLATKQMFPEAVQFLLEKQQSSAASGARSRHEYYFISSDKKDYAVFWCCVTMQMSADQQKREIVSRSGLHVYNHNPDTGKVEFYESDEAEFLPKSFDFIQSSAFVSGRTSDWFREQRNVLIGG